MRGCLLVLGFSIVATTLVAIGALAFYLGGIVGTFLLGGFWFASKGLIQIIGLCLAIGLLIGGAMLYQDSKAFLETAVLTQGTVTHYGQHGDGDDATYYYAIRFQTAEGNFITTEKSLGTYPARGSTVEILYDPANPTHTSRDSWMELWSLPVVAFCLGSALAVEMAVKLAGPARRKPEPDPERRGNLHPAKE